MFKLSIIIIIGLLLIKVHQLDTQVIVQGKKIEQHLQEVNDYTRIQNQVLQLERLHNKSLNARQGTN